MRDPEKLKMMIMDYLSGVMKGFEIENASNEGRNALLMEEVHDALRSNDHEKVTAILPEIALVSQAGGYTRGRFDLVAGLVKVIQRWDHDPN